MKDRYHDIYLQIGLNIQRVETAYTAPTLATLLDIAQALEVPLEKLLEIPK